MEKQDWKWRERKVFGSKEERRRGREVFESIKRIETNKNVFSRRGQETLDVTKNTEAHSCVLVFLFCLFQTVNLLRAAV